MATRFPNLFLVGAMKAGTTTVHQVLSAHPDIFMSAVKEPKFFAFQKDTTLFRGPGDPGNRRFYVDRQRYLGLFEEWDRESYAGESSTMYLYREEAPRNILEIVPDARIVVILREPVERAYSAYTFARQRGHESAATFREAVSLEERRIERGWGPLWHYKRRGLYAGQLARYLGIFPRDQVFVGLFDDLRARPRELYGRLLGFLELEERPLPIDTVANRSFQPRFSVIQRALGLANRLPAVVRPLVRRGAVGRLAQRVANQLVRWNAREVPKLSEEDATWLRPFFEDDVKRLEDLLGLSLQTWLRDDRCDDRGEGSTEGK